MTTFGDFLDLQDTFDVFTDAFWAFCEIADVARQMKEYSDFCKVVDMARSQVESYRENYGRIKARLFAVYLGMGAVKRSESDFTACEFEYIPIDANFGYVGMLNTNILTPVTLRLVEGDVCEEPYVVDEVSIW